MLPAPLKIPSHRQPQPLQTICPARPQHPVQAPPHLLHTAEAAFDLAVPHGMLRAGHTHTQAGHCAQWLLSGFSSSGNLQKSSTNPQYPQTTSPALPQHPVQVPPHLLHIAEDSFDFAVPYCMPRDGQSHTGRALCTMVAKRRLLSQKTPEETHGQLVSQFRRQ